MSTRPKQLARKGEFYLEEAVLDVLLEARHQNECLGRAEIGRRAGIFREPGHAGTGGNDAIVWGLLGKLAKQGRVEPCLQNSDEPDKKKGWKLTDEEYQTRKD